MKRYFLLALLCCCSIYSMGQGMFGFQAGPGFSTGGYGSKKTLSVEGYYLHKIIPGLYAGGSMYLQRYNLHSNVFSGTNIAYNDVISVSQKSSYLFFSPKVDYGFGVRKYIHIHAMFGVGVLMGGKQFTDTYAPFWTPPGGTPYGADTVAVNTSYNIAHSVTRFGFGLTERIPTRGYWNITLSQDFGSMSGGLSKGPYPFTPSYFCFTVGVMHKYPLVFVAY